MGLREIRSRRCLFNALKKQNAKAAFYLKWETFTQKQSFTSHCDLFAKQVFGVIKKVNRSPIRFSLVALLRLFQQCRERSASTSSCNFLIGCFVENKTSQKKVFCIQDVDVVDLIIFRVLKCSEFQTWEKNFRSVPKRFSANWYAVKGSDWMGFGFFEPMPFTTT